MDQVTVIGQTNFRGQYRPFGIYDDDRRRHVYIIGKTGVGKTTLIENMILQDINAGKGLALVDPHGDVAEHILESIPPERTNDVIYFNPADVDNPIAFNVLEAIDPQYKYLVASGLVSSLKKIWADSWGPRLEYILRNVILALLDYPGSTMLGIMRLLADKTYRKKVVESIQDPVVKSFWVNEFANYNERFRSEAISPIQNKVGQFLSSAIIRNIVAQPKSTIDMSEIMNEGKILLVNVSKGRIGEDNSALLGAMIITKLQLAAMDRASIPEEDRRDFYLYVDEFQNFATESFATILSEARKYRLNLTIAHQYITQMEEPVRDAVFGNVGTLICFRIGAFDAEFLEAEFAPACTPSDLVNLDKYNAYIKLMIQGVTSPPFSMQTIPPSGETFDSREKVVRVSRERYGNSRQDVEEKITRWSGLTFEQEGKAEGRDMVDTPRQAQERRDRPPKRVSFDDRRPSQSQLREEITNLASVLANRDTQNDRTGNRERDERRGDERKKKKRKAYPAVCSDCGKDTDVPFKPDPEKPVYCKECFEKRKVAGTVPPKKEDNSMQKEAQRIKNELNGGQQKPKEAPKPQQSFSGPPPPPPIPK